MSSTEQTRFHQFLDQAEGHFDQLVDAGSDQELFVSGYLHGHFSLVVSQALMANNWDISGLNQSMLVSLQTAFDQGELEPADQQQVLQMWNQVMEIA